MKWFSLMIIATLFCSCMEADNNSENRNVPEIVSFTVTPSRGNVGDNYIFSWVTENADSVTIEPAISGQEELQSSGTQSTELLYSNWYTLRAQSSGTIVSRRLFVEATYPEGSNWAFPRGDQMCSNRSTAKAPETGNLIWSLPGKSKPQIVAHDGSVYVQRENNLSLINSDGTIKWDAPGTYFPILLTETGNMIGSRQSSKTELVNLNADGSEKWVREIPFNENRSQHSVTGILLGPTGNLIVTTSEIEGTGRYANHRGQIIVFNEAGDMISNEETGSLGIPVLTRDDEMLVNEANGEVYYYSHYINRFDLLGNYLGAEFNVGNSGVYAMLTDPENDVLFRAYGGNVLYFNLDDDSQWYSDETSGVPIGGYDLARGQNGMLYATSYIYTTILRAIHPNGHLAWSIRVPGNRSTGSKVIVDSEERLFVINGDTVSAFESNGTFLWKHHEPGEGFSNLVPSIDGTLYVGGREALYAFKDK